MSASAHLVELERLDDCGYQFHVFLFSGGRPGFRAPPAAACRTGSERLADGEDQGGFAGILELDARWRSRAAIRKLIGEAVEVRGGRIAAAFRAGVDVGRAQDPAVDVLGYAELPVGVIGVGSDGAGAPVLQTEGADMAVDAPTAAQVVGCRKVQVVGASGSG